MLGTRESFVAPLAATTAMVWALPVEAQLNLPPPPPPPLVEPNDVPSLPPPPAPAASSAAPESPRRPASPPARTPRGRPPAATRPETYAPPATVLQPTPRIAAVTWNPAGIAWGRLSANVEVELLPRHALVASLDALVFHADRGSSRDLLSEGFGFASPTSLGFGGELGYHYWPSGLPTLSGPFVGPSFVFGATTRATLGDAAQAQGYWGLALDAGIQQVLAGGFTAGAGGGIEILTMADVTAVVPRILAQVGWSF